MFSITKESLPIKIMLAALMALLLLGCIYASFYYNDALLLGSFENFNNDDVRYLRSAKTLLETGKLTYRYTDASTVFIMPGIVFFLTPFVALFGMEGAVMPVRIFFAFLQTFNLYLVFIIARRIFNSRVAIVTAILSLLYLPNIYVSTVILTEPITYAAILLLMCMVIEGTEKKQKRYFIIGGIFWGIAVMFRSTMAAFPIIVFIYCLFKRFKFMEIVRFALCAIIPFVIVLSPWVIRNYVVFDRFIPLTLASGNPRLQGTIIDYSPEERQKMYDIVNADEVEYGETEISVDAAENEIAGRIFEYNIKNNTAEYLKWYTIGKTIKNFERPYLWYPIFCKTYKPITAYHVILVSTFLVSVLVMLLRRKMNANIGLLLVTILFFNCVHLPFYCFARYTYPVMCFIMMIDAYMLCDIFCFIKEKVKRITN